MLSSKGPRLSLTWITPLLLVLAFCASAAAKFCYSVSTGRAAVLLLNLVGTIVFASAFEVPIPRHGSGWLDSLRFAIKDLPQYGSTPSFNIVRFYVGLVLLFVGMFAATVVK